MSQAPGAPMPPRYLVDYETVARTNNPLEVIEALVDRTAPANFWRDGWCQRCEWWNSEKGEDRPVRPFAENCLEACAGCILSHLDENPAWFRARAEERRRRRSQRAPKPATRPAAEARPRDRGAEGVAS